MYLNTHEREALELMGWDSRAWDSGDVRVGLFGSTGWNLLTREQQVIAGLLGFSKETWGPSAQGNTNGRGGPIWPAWTAAATLEALCQTAARTPEYDYGGPVCPPAEDPMPPPYGKRQRTFVTANPHGGGMEGYENDPQPPPVNYAAHAQSTPGPYGNMAVGVMHPGHPMHAGPAMHAFTYPAGYEPSYDAGGAMQMQQPLRHMPCLQTSLTSTYGPYLPKLIPLSNDQPDVATEPKAEAPPSTICHGSLLFLGGDNVAGHHKVNAAGQRVCPNCQSARLTVPHDRARILLNADECRWSKAREFYVAWSVAPDCTISARRWRLASSTDVTHDLVVFSSAMGTAKADAALAAQGGVQKLVEVDGEATFSMCSRVKTFCPARNFGRGMGRGCIMHYQKRRAPMADPAAAGLLLGVGATLQHTAQYADSLALSSDGGDGGDATETGSPSATETPGS